MTGAGGERESECHQCEPILASYVDGVAPARDRERIEKHIEACACCRDWLARERVAHEALRARRSGLRTCASEHLKARCAAHAARKAAAPPARFSPSAVRTRPSLIRRWAPMTAAAALVLAVAGLFGLRLSSPAQALALQTTADHVKCSRFHVPEGAADPVTTAQEWQARFGWPLRLPTAVSEPPAEAGPQLRTVRRCAVTDGRVAHLIYSYQGAPLSVYVLPKRTLVDEAQFVRRFQHETVMWSQGDRTYIIVSSGQRDELPKMMAYVRAAAY
jgi:anti-sigma factor RsiW